MSGHGPNPNVGAPQPLRAFLDGIDILGRLDGWMGAACLAALTCLMLAEVAVRALSDIFPWVPADIPVAWEYSSYLMASAFTFGAAMTLRAGGHIRVTLVLARVSPAVRRWMETVLAALFAEPSVRRVVVEPDVRNDKIHQLNRYAGFVYHGEIALPHKRAALAFCTRAQFDAHLQAIAGQATCAL